MKYMSARELGLTEREKDALVVTRQYLMGRGPFAIEHEPDPLFPAKPHGFNIGPYKVRHGTGLCACVSGWANELTGEFSLRRMAQFDRWNLPPVATLFSANRADGRVARLDLVTPAMAAEAIQGVLAQNQYVDWIALTARDVTPKRVRPLVHP